MIFSQCLDTPKALHSQRLSFDRPTGVRLWLARLFNAALAMMILAATVSAAYLCKCKMGIDLMEGPSCLHNSLYWIVR